MFLHKVDLFKAEGKMLFAFEHLFPEFFKGEGTCLCASFGSIIEQFLQLFLFHLLFLHRFDLGFKLLERFIKVRLGKSSQNALLLHINVASFVKLGE